jgi:AcrR family transcriptional regulator
MSQTKGLANARRRPREHAAEPATPPLHAPAGVRAVARPRKRRPEIIAAAARVFAERGYNGTTTTDIADALGIRQGSLYYYFNSREEALEAVCEQGATMFVRVAETIATEGLRPREALKKLVIAHLAPLSPGLDFVRVFINERRYLSTSSRRRLGRLSRRIEKVFQNVIEAGIADGSFRKDVDARLAMLAILGMCNSVQGWMRREGRPLEEVQQALADLAVNAVAA